jgi:hypothetical protein
MTSTSPEEATAPPRPSLALRAVAAVILSSWVRRRVRHQSVRAVLATVAYQVGRSDIAAELERSP